jgi:hypothetical protein
MLFIDLFAGLGGFHQALATRGGECVFASEIDGALAELYEKNFGITPEGDIRKADLKSIPDHSLLCAGFPCQPFSKAGDQGILRQIVDDDLRSAFFNHCLAKAGSNLYRSTLKLQTFPDKSSLAIYDAKEIPAPGYDANEPISNVRFDVDLSGIVRVSDAIRQKVLTFPLSTEEAPDRIH